MLLTQGIGDNHKEELNDRLGWVFNGGSSDLLSFATALAEAGVAESVADAILNHKQSATRGGVLGVYQRAQRWPEQVDAMKVWDCMLRQELP